MTMNFDDHIPGARQDETDFDPFEAGYELSQQEPDLLLIEVWRRASPDWERAEQEAFLMGYIAMRRQRDEREQEDRA
jgi:hypothetical protein